MRSSTNYKKSRKRGQCRAEATEKPDEIADAFEPSSATQVVGPKFKRIVGIHVVFG